MKNASGVLLVAKPKGPTSHDVVAMVRRRLQTKRVGHAGTLDPMATGLLVVLVGEATKLEPFLAAADKTYVAGVALGRTTTTFDAEGETVEEAGVSAHLAEELRAFELSRAAPCPSLRAALSVELARTAQVPPAFSAIKVDGVRSYARARAGEVVTLAERQVRVIEAELSAARASAARVDVTLTVTKGYYVRSFARDFGATLGCGAHLVALERTRAGSYRLEDAAALDDDRVDIGSRLTPVARAASDHMAAIRLDADQERLVGLGRSLDAARVAGAEALVEGARVAVLDATGCRLLAVSTLECGAIVTVRGFRDA